MPQNEIQSRTIPAIVETSVVSLHVPDSSGTFYTASFLPGATASEIQAEIDVETGTTNSIVVQLSDSTYDLGGTITLTWQEDYAAIAIPALAYLTHDDTGSTQYTFARTQAGGSGGGGGGGTARRKPGLNLGLGLGL